MPRHHWRSHRQAARLRHRAVPVCGPASGRAVSSDCVRGRIRPRSSPIMRSTSTIAPRRRAVAALLRGDECPPRSPSRGQRREPRRLLHDYRFLRLGDLLSLTFCNGWPEPQADAFGYRIRFDGARLTVSPDPSAGGFMRFRWRSVHARCRIAVTTRQTMPHAHGRQQRRSTCAESLRAASGDARSLRT